MKTPDYFELPPAPVNPLDYAATINNEPIVDTVRNAIQKKNVMLAYQPVVHAKKPGKPAFYEALIRVLNKAQEVVPAKDFIPIVENTEMGRVLDCHALELGIQASTEEPSLRLSINMSARSIGYPKWMEILNEGISLDDTIAERLILEITEESAMSIPELVTRFIWDLQKREFASPLMISVRDLTHFDFSRIFSLIS